MHQKALGAILSQKDNNNKEHPIAYDSKVLTKYESNYDTTRLEASAIIWAVKNSDHTCMEENSRSLQIITL